MEVAKVQARGQITLPSAVRKAANIKPGAFIGLRATGPGRIEIHVLSQLTAADLFERWPIEGPINEVADREAWQEVAAADILGD